MMYRPSDVTDLAELLARPCWETLSDETRVKYVEIAQRICHDK